jgi:hypothetical protein
MPSDKQLQANRENAKKSTGPITEAGKRRSSLNAVRHGLTGQVVVLPAEEIEAYTQFSTPIAEGLETVGALEIQLAAMYTGFLWRINRAASVEDNMFGLGHMEQVAENLNIEHPEAHNAATHAKTFRNEYKAFDRIGLYTQRLVNNANKILKQLKDIQAERRRRELQEMDEAARLYQFHRMQELAFDPTENGFDFSVDQIRRHIRLENLKKHSADAEKLDYNQRVYRKIYGNRAA